LIGALSACVDLSDTELKTLTNEIFATKSATSSTSAASIATVTATFFPMNCASFVATARDFDAESSLIAVRIRGSDSWLDSICEM